jgi:glycosyltransferase involved in cell wall biosynthesis
MNESVVQQNCDTPLLSVVIPVYNERATIAEIISRVQVVALDKQIIIVDDYSTDGTREYLAELAGACRAAEAQGTLAKGRLKFLFQDRNYGKGAALRRGFREVTGQIVVIQDADLELNPEEYGRLVEPIQLGLADVVYGSRFLNKGREEVPPSHYWGNKFLTGASNITTGLKLTDVWTCYKTFRREVLDGIELRENRFAFEPEFTAKIASCKWRVCEVPVSYACRTNAEGKKISWKDGFRGIACTIYYGIVARFQVSDYGESGSRGAETALTNNVRNPQAVPLASKPL